MQDNHQDLLKSISDLHLKEIMVSGTPHLDIGGSLIFPGPRRPEGEFFETLLRALYERVVGVNRNEFSIRIDAPYDVIFRVTKTSSAVDGVWYRMRRMSMEAPNLETLPSRFPTGIERILLSETISQGGLILVAGQPGSGKTTTACAIVSSRLRKLGGFAYTVEDPPEILAMNGWHEGELRGFCSQNEVYDGDDGWERSIKDVLRSQPVGSNLILYVGEIRTEAAARMMLRAASNGFLVVTTTFATDLISAIDTVRQLIREDYVTSLAAMLRIVVYQRLVTDASRRLLEAVCLVSDGSHSRVAATIRSGSLSMLKDEIIYQTNLVRRGALLETVGQQPKSPAQMSL